MKLWWPWRKKKPLSLFETRIPWCWEKIQQLSLHFCTNDRPPFLGPHPLNAPGDFYVENGECISCGAPESVAPDLIAWETIPGDPHVHCYFKKQPADSFELKQAIDAIAVSCCGALRYTGSDPKASANNSSHSRS
jgi:hypothetical protein